MIPARPRRAQSSAAPGRIGGQFHVQEVRSQGQGLFQKQAAFRLGSGPPAAFGRQPVGGDDRPRMAPEQLRQIGLLQVIEPELGPQALAGGPQVPGAGPVHRGLHHRHADA